MFSYCWGLEQHFLPPKSCSHMATRRNIRYSRLPTDEGDYDYDDRPGTNNHRYDYVPKSYEKVPWKSIGLACFLLCLGCLLLLISFFIYTGHMGGELSQAYGLCALGVLSFIPGFYETRIAYYSWRGAQGYRFSLIPDY
ncbi:PREDICTED: transmembrane protein 230-like isoform X1 [Ipomoea nil]|uniref:transmembrane protein 230-like isoform X1 n=2 Tax=Ipomoea nil TaxID=35883 RepID=UPI000901A6B9|nr:PREDICTED: transmembrane protein 230-like isoform X1 [Ipomoea nil]